MYELPIALCGVGIRTDYRVILDIIVALNDPDLSEEEKALATIQILYTDWNEIKDYQEALQQAFWFISMGENSKKFSPKIMDWEQDFKLIIPSINKVLGQEVRSLSYMHWWTFLGAYYEIGESTFSNIVNIRSKRSRGRKLEKHEQEFYNENREVVDMRTKYSKEEKEEIERFSSILQI